MRQPQAKKRQLTRLTPQYVEKHHAGYVKDLLDAVTGSAPAHNVALAGAYGTGKSSILQGLKQELERAGGTRSKGNQLIEISLSNFHQPDKRIARQSGEASLSAVLQKEIVKRLLYSRNPRDLPLSRFKRIAQFDIWNAFWFSITVTVLTLVALFFLLGPDSWSQRLSNSPVHPILSLLLSVSAMALVLILVQRLIHRFSVVELSVGAASVKLGDKVGTYFDQFLDELVYFFSKTGTQYVIFEDLDRFNNQGIFQALRDLNSILNHSPAIKQDVVFIYAVRDSLFEPQIANDKSAEKSSSDTEERSTGSESSVQTKKAPSSNHRYGVESPASERAKFFDLIIPIVPFISHGVSSDLLYEQLENLSPALPANLVALAGRFFTDMRVILSIRNEYLIYVEELYNESDISGLDIKQLFAMILYKHLHLADYERIRTGESKLDALAKSVRDMTKERLRAIDNEVAELLEESAITQRFQEHSVEWGQRLQDLISIMERGYGRAIQVAVNGRSFSLTDVETPECWATYAAQPGPIVVTFSNHNRRSIEVADIDRFVVPESVISTWRERTTETINRRIASLRQLRTRLETATFTDRIIDESFSGADLNGQHLSIPARAREVLGDGLALELLRAGHIDNNFALYTSTYYGRLLSPKARTFMLQVMDRFDSAPDFELSPEDLGAILKVPGYNLLRTQSALNFSIFEHLAEDDRLEPTIQMLASGSLDKDGGFLDAFLGRSEVANTLVARLAPVHAKILESIVLSDIVTDAKKRSLLDSALARLGHDLDYIVSDPARETLAKVIDTLPVLRKELSPARAQAIANILRQNEIFLSSLSGVHPSIEKYVLEAGAFAINAENLLELTPAQGKIGLDTLSSLPAPMMNHILMKPMAYLNALETLGAQEPYSVDDPERLGEVIGVVSMWSDDLLDRLLLRTHPEAKITLLADAPASSWRSLARTNRYAPTVANLVTYLKESSDLELHNELAKSLSNTQELLLVEEAPVDDRTRLAEWLVNHEDVSVEATLTLIPQLALAGPIPIQNLGIADGRLFAGLITGEHIEDTADSYHRISALPWEEKEPALAASTALSEFVTHLHLDSEEFMLLIESSAIATGVKDAILADVQTLQDRGVLNRGLATATLMHAISEGLEVGDEELLVIAEAGAPSELITKALGRNLLNRTQEGIVRVLRRLTGDYRNLAEANGHHPRVKADADVERLLERLQALELVSSFDLERDEQHFRVHMKKRRPSN